MDRLEDIKKFVSNPPWSRNRWFKIDDADVYLRVSRRIMGNDGDWKIYQCIDVSTVNINDPKKQKKGTFTKILTYIESLGQPIFIENTLEELIPFFERRGYTRDKHYKHNICFFKVD